MARSLATRSIAIGAATVLALLALPADAQWKWKDGTGRVQYSDLPPPTSTPEKDILARPNERKTAVTPVFAASGASGASAAGSASAMLAPKTTDPELEAKRKKYDAEQAARVKADEDKVAAARADNCLRSKSQLKTLESGVRVAKTNEKGEREILDDEGRDTEMKRSRALIASDCK